MIFLIAECSAESRSKEQLVLQALFSLEFSIYLNIPKPLKVPT